MDALTTPDTLSSKRSIEEEGSRWRGSGGREGVRKLNGEEEGSPVLRGVGTGRKREVEIGSAGWIEVEKVKKQTHVKLHRSQSSKICSLTSSSCWLFSR